MKTEQQAMQEQTEGAQHTKEQLAAMVKRYSDLYDGVISVDGMPFRFNKKDKHVVSGYYIQIGGCVVATKPPFGNTWIWRTPYIIPKSFDPVRPFAHLSPFGLHEAAKDHPYLTDSEFLNKENK